MDSIDEHSDPVGIAPRRILVAFPIQNEHLLTHVGSDGVHEIIGLTGGVAAARVMVEAKALATLLHASRLAGHVSVGEAGALRGLDHGEVVVGGASDRRGLPAGHVDAVHVGHCRRRRTDAPRATSSRSAAPTSTSPRIPPPRRAWRTRVWRYGAACGA